MGKGARWIVQNEGCLIQASVAGQGINPKIDPFRKNLSSQALIQKHVCFVNMNNTSMIGINPEILSRLKKYF